MVPYWWWKNGSVPRSDCVHHFFAAIKSVGRKRGSRRGSSHAIHPAPPNNSTVPTRCCDDLCMRAIEAPSLGWQEQDPTSRKVTNRDRTLGWRSSDAAYSAG